MQHLIKSNCRRLLPYFMVVIKVKPVKHVYIRLTGGSYLPPGHS